MRTQKASIALPQGADAALPLEVNAKCVGLPSIVLIGTLPSLALYQFCARVGVHDGMTAWLGRSRVPIAVFVESVSVRCRTDNLALQPDEPVSDDRLDDPGKAGQSR